MDEFDSSLSLIDFGEEDDGEDLLIKALPHSERWASPELVVSASSANDNCASPIPVADECLPLATEPVLVTDPPIPCFGTPKQEMCTATSSNFSPFNPESVIASTPFHHQTQPPIVTEGSTASFCASYDLGQDGVFVEPPVREATNDDRGINVTYDAIPDPYLNSTYISPNRLNDFGNPSCGIVSSALVNDEVPERVPAVNKTFVVPSTCVKEKPRSDITACFGSSEFDISSSMQSVRSCEKTKRSGQDQHSASLDKPGSGKNKSALRSVKPLSERNRFNFPIKPRMNAAAVSRIQACSPKKPPVQDENSSLFNPPAKSFIKKPQTRKTAPRRSLLPPPKSRATTTTAAGGRSTKFDSTNHPPSSARTTASSFGAGGVATSRIASLSSRTNSKVQRTGNTSRASRPSTGGTAAISGLAPPTNYKGKLNKNLPTKRPQAAKPTINPTNQCAVAMATLLDFVVNKLDGLSAPQLQIEKQQLIIGREKVDQLVTEQCMRIETLQEEVKEVKQQLDAAKEAMREQKEENEKMISAMQENLRRNTEEHDEEVTQLRLCWTAEKDELLQNIEDLQTNINGIVDQKVEELVQPYINAHDENKSLRAVLDMKNADQHKLQVALSQKDDLMNEVRDLRDQLIFLQQKNEDLETQVQDKSEKERCLQQEVSRLRQLVDEQQHSNSSQQQRIEELVYRINSPSTPLSPFNPVFTPSSGDNFPHGDNLNSRKNLSERFLSTSNCGGGGS